MRGLLTDMPARLPSDCLLARIKGRRSFLVRNWERLLLEREPLKTLPAAPWRQAPETTQGWPLHALQQEYFWAFSRMDEQMRSSTAPFFWLAEVRTMALCLRLLSGEKAGLTALLQNSLLSSSISGVLRKAGNTAVAVAGLTGILADYDSRFAGLEQTWRTGGFGSIDSAMHDISMTIIMESAIHPVIRSYMALLIDCCNLTRVSKQLRWHLSSTPLLLGGGSLSLPRFEKLFQQRDSQGLLYLAKRLGGQMQYSEGAELERVLHQAQGRVLRRLSREESGIGALLDYLWRCGNEAANIGLLEGLKTAGSKFADEELRL